MVDSGIILVGLLGWFLRQDFKKQLQAKVPESLLGSKGLDLKRFAMVYERLPQKSLLRLAEAADRLGECPSMGLFRDPRCLVDTKTRASSVPGLSERAQVAFTYRLMGELESKYVKVDKSAQHRMRVAEGLLEEEQKLSLRQMAGVFDEKLTSSKLKLSPEEEESLILLFAAGEVDSHCSAESTTPAKQWPAVKKLLWQRQAAACAALRVKNEEDLEETKQKLADLEQGGRAGGSCGIK